jgi:cytochrome P450
MPSISHHRPLTELADLVPLHTLTQSTDPETAYARLRAQWGEVAPVELEPGIPVWLVLGYHEIIQVSRAGRLFSRSSNDWRFMETLRKSESKLGAMMTARDHAYHSDGDKHRRLRAPLDDAVAGLDQHKTNKKTKEICLELIGRFADRREADLVTDYAVFVPMLAVASWFGFGIEDGYRFMAAIRTIFDAGEEARASYATVQQILGDLIAVHREEPADDLTTAFLRHPNFANDSEIVESILLMIGAGYEATTGWIGETLRLMLTDPRFSRRLRGGRLNLDDALDEVLWRRPPGANMNSWYALADCELAGQPIQRGDALFMSFAAANLDPRVHSKDPWLEIGNRAHLAWGAGPHVCPAHNPSRMIVRIAVETVLTRLHDLKLTISADEIVPLPSTCTVCPASLPVQFTRFV